MACKIVYNTGGSDITLTFKRGPVNFQPYWDGRVHVNLSTSGAVQERVVENLDILISFELPHLVLTDDMTAWDAFQAWALAGGGFKFYPSDGLADYYNCVAEDTGWGPERNAPQKYGAKVVIRILQDSRAPSGPNVVLRRFHGIAV